MSARKLVRAKINTFSRTAGARKLVRAKINTFKVDHLIIFLFLLIDSAIYAAGKGVTSQ